MLDDLFDQTETLNEQPAWQPLPERVRAAFNEPLPLGPSSVEEAYRQFVTDVVPYTTANRHPRAWGWVRGNGTVVGMLAEMLVAGLNAHLAGGNQAPALVEEQVLRWLAEAMGMPPGTSGLLTSGGTMANLLGLAVARHAKAGFDVRAEGLQGRPQMTVYCSAETHLWARKSMELLGLGRHALRQVGVDGDYRVNTAALRVQIAADRQAGLHPIAVIANAGTVSTGAVDDLRVLHQLCREEDLWFHVDGAFGALLKFAPEYAQLVDGLELADSLGFDLHKWMYLPFEAGCVLVRDAELHRAAFAAPASYLEPAMRGMLAGGLAFSDRGIELSRSFKALKVWMALKVHGLREHGALIAQNMRQAEYLERLVHASAELELLAPRAMNIVCFRYAGVATDLNALNRELVLRLQESGRFVVSGTMLGERYAVRVANTNHRSRMEDFAELAETAAAMGRAIAQSAASGCDADAATG